MLRSTETRSSHLNAQTQTLAAAMNFGKELILIHSGPTLAGWRKAPSGKSILISYPTPFLMRHSLPNSSWYSNFLLHSFHCLVLFIFALCCCCLRYKILSPLPGIIIPQDASFYSNSSTSSSLSFIIVYPPTPVSHFRS